MCSFFLKSEVRFEGWLKIRSSLARRTENSCRLPKKAGRHASQFSARTKTKILNKFYKSLNGILFSPRLYSPLQRSLTRLISIISINVVLFTNGLLFLNIFFHISSLPSFITSFFFYFPLLPLRLINDFYRSVLSAKNLLIVWNTVVWNNLTFLQQQWAELHFSKIVWFLFRLVSFLSSFVIHLNPLLPFQIVR